MNAVLEARFIVARKELENLIVGRWGYSYTILAATGHENIMEFSVRGTFATPALAERAVAIRHGRRDRDLGLILNVLCADGVIPAGTYTIREELPPISPRKWKRGDLKVIGVAC